MKAIKVFDKKEDEKQLEKKCREFELDVDPGLEEEEYANILMEVIVNRAAQFDKEKYNAIVMDIVPLKNARTYLVYMVISILTKFLGITAILPRELEKIGEKSENIIYENFRVVNLKEKDLKPIMFVGTPVKTEGFVSVLKGLSYGEVLKIAEYLYNYDDEKTWKI